MFEGLFYELRDAGVSVAMDEWLCLQEALERDLVGSSLGRLYQVGRAVLVKSEREYDAYDVAFERYFSGLAIADPEIPERVWQWLAGSPTLGLTPEQRAALDRLLAEGDLDALRRRFEERLRNQTEAHTGGSRHIGTGGTSPFGHSGWHPGGIRIGGEGRARTALQVAGERRFRDLAADETLGVREFGLALRRLKRLSSRLDGPLTELDLEGTIDATAAEGGRLRLTFRRPRRNAVRVLLLLDIGGSMDEHVVACSRLFSAVHQASHFRDLQIRYFHNCVYDLLYETAAMDPRRAMSTHSLLAQLPADYKLVIVGDACMAPSELTMAGGAIDYYQHNEEPGWTWLSRVTDHFTHRVWLNPIARRWWPSVHGAPTLDAIADLLPMHELSLTGLEAAVGELMVQR